MNPSFFVKGISPIYASTSLWHVHMKLQHPMQSSCHCVFYRRGFSSTKPGDQKRPFSCILASSCIADVVANSKCGSFHDLAESVNEPLWKIDPVMVSNKHTNGSIFIRRECSWLDSSLCALLRVYADLMNPSFFVKGISPIYSSTSLWFRFNSDSW